MSNKKKHLIGLYLKCSRFIYTAQKNLKANEIFLRASFQNTEDDDFERIFSEHGISQFTEQMTSVVDSQFTEEEVQSLIDFFTSPVGRKLVNKTHLLIISGVMNDITLVRQDELLRLEKE